MGRVSFQVFLLVAAAVSGASAKKQEGCGEEVAQLKRELAEAQGALSQCGHAAQPFSFSEGVRGVWSLGGDVTSRLLDQTSADEVLAEKVSAHYGKAKEFTAQVVDKVSSVNYAEHMEALKSHDVYVKHVAPRLDVVTKAAKPYVDQYVTPMLEKAEPHLKTATQKVQEEVLPALKRGHSQVLDSISQAPKHLEKAGSFLDPLFDTIARMAPSHASVLPTSLGDRVLLILACAFLLRLLIVGMGDMFSLMRWCLRVALYLVRICVKVFRVCVLLPVRITLKVFSVILWLSTGFYCCGLCRRKNKVEDLSGKAAKKSKAAATKDPTVTVAEVTELLEKAKKEKKLEAAAKQLIALMKKDKPMTAPKQMEGKRVTKDVVAKAMAKFKELDVKKLGL